MKKTLLILIWLISLSTLGQDIEQSQELKERYYSTSINVGEFEDRLSDSLQLANTEHPVRFFMICGSFYQDSLLNEAAVAYFIGRNRFKLYNKTNQDYEASADGALAGSFAFAYGEVLKQYLTKNLNNYGKIMQFTGEWYSKNQHFYFDSAVNDSLYQFQTNSILEFSDLLLNNPTDYIQQLEDQRIQMENQRKEMEEFMKNLNDSIEEEEIEEEGKEN